MFTRKRIFYFIGTVIYLSIISLFSSIPDTNCHTSMFERILNNLLHIPAYGGLAFLIFKTINQPKDYSSSFITRNLFIAGIVAFLLGALNEVHQAFVPGRMVSLMDLLLNTTGIAIVLLTVYFNPVRKKDSY